MKGQTAKKRKRKIPGVRTKHPILNLFSEAHAPHVAVFLRRLPFIEAAHYSARLSNLLVLIYQT